MTTRERWIVYPLLALALGSSIKSRLVHRFECHTLVVRQIEIVDRQSRRQATLGVTPNGGELLLISPRTAEQTTISPHSIRTPNVVTEGLDGRLQLLKIPVRANVLVRPVRVNGKAPEKKKPGPKD